MQQFTPPTEIVRARYVEFSGGVPEGLEATRDHVEGGAFDRWLAKVKADALREAAAASNRPENGAPYEVWAWFSIWMRERADQIESV